MRSVSFVPTRSLPPLVKMTAIAVRRFARIAGRLDAPHHDVESALDHLGYVQLDPINVCGRMHDLVLRNRVAGYREHDLLRYLHGPGFERGTTLPVRARRAFEHYRPSPCVLAAFPAEAWPHLVGFMEERRARTRGYGGRLSPTEERVARRVLDEIAERGPLCTDDIVHEGSAISAWGSRGRLVKTVLDKLFFHGRVLLATRRGFRRVYDLPERVLPASLLNAESPSTEETRRWLIHLRLKQRRLVALSRAEVRVVADLVQQVSIEGCPPCFCLREDAAALDAARAGTVQSGAPVHLLAPLDPLIYDRRLTAALWGFAYTWEVYTPPDRRVRGYYALPVLAGTRLVGHVEPKADRKRGHLDLVSRRIGRGVSVRPAVRELAHFLGLAPRR